MSTGGFVDPNEVAKTIAEMQGQSQAINMDSGSAAPPMVTEEPAEGAPPAGVAGDEGQPTTEPVQGQPPVEPGGEGSGEAGGQITPAGDEPPASGYTLPDGSVLSEEALARIQELAAYDNALKSNPQVRAALDQAMAGQTLGTSQLPPSSPYPNPYAPVAGAYGPVGYPAPQAPTPPAIPGVAPYGQPLSPLVAPGAGQQVQLPPGVDSDDPTVQFVVAQQAQIAAQIAQMQQAQQQVIAAGQQQALAASVHKAEMTIKSKYPNLSVDDVARANMRAASLQIFPSLVAEHNGNLEKAAEAAIETALFVMPEVRDRLGSGQPASSSTQRTDAARRQQLNALAGGSGAAPKQNPATARPMTSQERQAAMVEELGRWRSGQQA